MSSPAQSNNLLMLRAALLNSFQDIAKCMSEEEFLKNVTMLKLKKSVVTRLHEVMEKDLYKAMDQDLQEFIKDECLIEGMKTKSKLTEETTVPHDVKLWRPPGDVNLHLRSLDAKKIQKECKKLESCINDLEKENKEIVERITKKRKSIEHNHDHVKQLLSMPFKLSELENTVKVGQEIIEKLYNDVP